MSSSQLPAATHAFISRYIRSIEQLEILLLVTREPGTVWSPQQVYDTILSTPPSVTRWLNELAQNGLLEKVADPKTGYRVGSDPSLAAEIRALGELYRTTPVRVIEAIYQRTTGAAQSFADAFKIKPPDQNT